MPEITGVDQEPPDDKQQDLKTPDDNQNENDIKLGEADGHPSLLIFYDRHGNPVGDTRNPNADLTDAPEEETE